MSIYNLTPLPGFRHIELEETESTNTYARRHPQETESRLTLITAEFQSQGRGALGEWQSEPEQNLLFSLVCHPNSLPATQVFRISVAACLAICHALNEVAPGFLIKWPNDIYYGDRKAVGILIENELQDKFVGTAVIGAGVNVNQTLFTPDAPNPVSLAQIVGHKVDRTPVLQNIVENFHRLSEAILAPNWNNILQQYHSLLYRRQGMFPYSDSQGEFMAEMVQVDPDGHLLLRDEEGVERRYAFKEVSFIIQGELPQTVESH